MMVWNGSEYGLPLLITEYKKQKVKLGVVICDAEDVCQARKTRKLGQK